VVAELTIDGQSFSDCEGKATAEIHPPAQVTEVEAADDGAFTNTVRNRAL